MSRTPIIKPSLKVIFPLEYQRELIPKRKGFVLDDIS